MTTAGWNFGLASRDTEVLWDAIERDAGTDLSEAIATYVSFTRDAASEAPDDFPRLRQHLAALRMAGRSQEAIDFAEPIAQNWPLIEAVGPDAYGFINDYAYALSNAGRADEAHALMTRLISIGVSENRALVSMAINRAGLLMQWGDFKATLAALDELEDLGDGYVSDLGWMWFYEMKACSLHQLGRVEEAETVLHDSILPLAEENPSAYTETMLCLDQPDKAADIIIDRLHDETARQGAISSFTEGKQGFMPPFFAELQRRASRVRARPEVHKAFDEVGRALSINGARTYWGGF